MLKQQNLLAAQKRKLQKALQHLSYSYAKVQKLPTTIESLSDENLETWESFAARFSRVSDLFLTQYLRSLILADDPGFSGTLRDFVNQGEKLGIIDSAQEWMSIRELRNITAHEYSEEDLAAFFVKLREKCPKLLKLLSTLSLEKD